MINLDNIFKSRDITLPTKVHLAKAMVFPVVMYWWESWTVQKAKCWRINAFEPWCWRRLLRVPWTAKSYNQSIQFSSVAQLCPTLCDPMDCSMSGLSAHHQFPEFTQTHIHWVADSSNHIILCRPLLLLPSIFPSSRVFTNESVLLIRWPKHWSFSFNISPSNEYLGLISFRMD